MTDTLVFDGDCGFCTTATRWVESSWPGETGNGKPDTVAWQLAGPERLAELGLSEADASGAAWWIDGNGARYRGHAAIGKALEASRSTTRRTAGKLILLPPVSWLARAVYPVAARYRHHLPGGTPACRL